MLNISRKSRGNQLEKWAKAWLEQEGYIVHRAEPQGVKLPNGFFVSRSNDIHHAFDLLTLKMNERPRYIQITTDTVGIGTKRKKIDILPLDSKYISVEVWQYTGGRSPEGQYFSIRRKDNDYELNKEHRIYLSTEFRNAN